MTLPCRVCGAATLFDSAERTPTPGDFFVCCRCGRLSILDLTMRELTEAERERIGTDPALAPVIDAVQRRVAQRN